MLTIRREQMDVLAHHSVAAQLTRHARSVAPQVCAQTSAAHLNAIIQYCMSRCEHYGMTRDFDVLRYLNLMLVFGVTFDRDQPWAAGPLAFRNPQGRMELLMDHALSLIPGSGDNPGSSSDSDGSGVDGSLEV